MIAFDDAPLSVVRVCETFAAFAPVERACLVRDVKGCVRLVLKLGPARAQLDLGVLTERLKTELGRLFVPPILCTEGDGASLDVRRLAQKLVETSAEWAPEYIDTAAGEVRTPTAGKWRRLERRLSKLDWLDAASAAPPWELEPGAPAVVTFYSFKGGIGRTTALTSCAWQLARQGRSVLVVDLDLEAPGAGTLLNQGQPTRGVLDFLLLFLITEERDVQELLTPAAELGAEQERVSVASAGTLGIAYLEKLARLDYSEDLPWKAGKPTPVQRALGALLSALRGARHFDYIFIDSRAGLHDLAGLSLHGLSHVDVILNRASEQGYQGLDLTLQVLARRRMPENLRCIVVHSFVAPERGSAAEQTELAAFRARSYQSFKQHVYDRFLKDEEIPEEKAMDQPHTPFVLHEDSALRSFGSLSGVEGALFGEDYQRLCARIVELCEAEKPGPEQGT